MTKIVQASWLARPRNNTQVKTAWERFLGGEAYAAGVGLRRAIDDSWRRCLVGRVDPVRGEALPRVGRDGLEALRKRHERLISASAPFMVQSRGLLAQTGTVMVLTDPEGTVLDVEGDPRIRDAMAAAGMVPGNNWQESSIGTNAIGTALALGQHIQVHGAEHFCEPIQKWTCSAAVIRDPVDASIVGVLDVSGLRRDYTPHSLPLVATTANSIENRLAQMELERRFQLLEAGVQRLSAADGVMLFDSRGRLVKANDRAAAALAAWGVALGPETVIPVGEGAASRAGTPPLQLPDWLLANRIEPVFRGGALLGFVVSVPLPVTASPFASMARGEPAAPDGRQTLLATMVDQSESVVSLKDLDGHYAFVNRRFEEVFGVKSADVLGRTDAQLFEAEPARRLRARDLEAMQRTQRSESVDEIPLGRRLVRLVTVRFPIFDEAGHVQAICTQATERGPDGAQGAAANAVQGLAGSDEGVMVTDARGVILTVNPAFTRITGYALEDIAGKRPSVLQSGLHSKAFYEGMWRKLAEQGRWQGEIQNRRKNGEIYPEWLTIYAVRGGEGAVQGYIAIFGDSSAQKDSQQRIRFMSKHDELTGLPNRALLMERLSDCVAEARRAREAFAVMLVDLDDFQGINDALGHDVGDALLQQVAERLRRCLCDAHTVARVGGDEFAVILRGCPADTLSAIAARALEYLSISFGVRGQELFATASIGISVFPADSDTAAGLLRDADTALHDAKAQGRNHVRFFAAEMQAQVQQRMSLETGLRAALDNDRFEVVYQPQTALADGALVGAEALLRWKDPVLGNVPAGRFIPAAEAAGLIVTLSEHVLVVVLAQIALWRRHGLVPPRISVNIAAQQLREPHFVENLWRLLERHGVPPEAICLELTEGTLMEDLDGARQMLLQLTEHGIAVSIDDFGTGYSSLAYLGRLPIQELKVDQSFVRGIADEAGKRSIITAIIDMAHALGMHVLAEGIETEDQLVFLKEHHCEMGQGYLFHHPLSPDAFEHLFAPAGEADGEGGEAVAIA
ncbi:EAL domain-containing protein [Azoarcus sp. DD4]|uniref:EAL domain-containing protein n=1 Tax=Azoarcus sp. DD4 TaxID=2027405 RepID=UPI00143D9280|nr:EAL domain-containing protein [Azoarcus sp. DD4]